MENISNAMKFYRYSIESFDILFTGEAESTKVETKNITGISIERDYDNNYFPIMRLSLVIPPKLYFKILKNKLTVKFRLRMQKYIYDRNNEYQFKKDIINDVFCLFVDEDTPFLAEKQYDESKNTDGTNTTPLDLGQEYTFFLFKESDLNNSKKIINSVISSGNMTNIISYCFSTAGIKNVLLSPLDNKNNYAQVILPPLPLLGNLLFLEQQYGFYSTGMLLFFDYDCVYLIDSGPKCKTWRNGEYKQTVFSIKESTNPDSHSPGCIDSQDDKKFYINITPDNIEMTSNSVVSDQLDGNNMIIIHPSTGSVVNMTPETVQRGAGTYKILINKYDNTYSNEVAKTKKKENNTNISVNIGDFDIDALTPNKEFLFVFENQSINTTFKGNYRISSNIITFIKQGEFFTISSNCDFKKII